MYDIIINKQKETRNIMLIENGNLVESYKGQNEEENIEGNIYLGKVQNVLPGMQAAFVNIGGNKNTFIHLKDILPKVDNKVSNVETNVNIKELIKPGMPILVQVKRAQSNKKGARVSTHISLSGKYIVFMPEAEFITVSQKIEDEKEIERLIKLMKEILPKGSGAIIRTSAENKQKDELEQDAKELIRKWKEIKKLKENEVNLPKLIYKSDSLTKKMLIDLISKDVANIYTNDKVIVEEVNELLEQTQNKDVKVMFEEEEKIFLKYDLQKQLEGIENRKIWLKCGGFITIDKTEALTAIDVNSGKYIGTKDLEQTIFTVNKEATIEIAKQLKLRDLGGIIVIDYIDMQEQKNKEEIEEILKEELKKDRSKTQIMGFTRLNLLEMTRKHICG